MFIKSKNVDSCFFYIIGIWFRLVDKRLKQILTMSKIKSNAPALLYLYTIKPTDSLWVSKKL